MKWKSAKSNENFLDSETGTIRKSFQGRIKVALVYPNTYHVGMSNLGFQSVYQLFNDMSHVVCERAFLPDDKKWPARRTQTVESQRAISEFDIIAFSISFENDYFG